MDASNIIYNESVQIAPGGIWQSKETGLTAEVVNATDSVVWYMHPSWTLPVNVTRDLWNETMQPVQAVA